MKKTLYEILGVSPAASSTEIHAAFLRLTQQHTTQPSGMDPADADIQIKIIKEAYSTLSDHGRRSGYDASLAARAAPARLEVEIQEPRWSPQKILLMVIGSLIAIGMTIQIGFMLLSYRHANGSLAEAQEAKVRLREYEMEMGQPKSASEIEEQRGAAEQRQLTNEARQRERELEESRRYAARISDERIRAEEQAKRQAEYEQKRLEQEESHRKQQEEYAVKRQLADEKRRLQELEGQNRR